MNFVEILLIGVGLSMDAVAVSLSDSFCYQGQARRRLWMLPIAFGFFQGMMPVLGYFGGSLFASLIDRYAGIVTLIILGVIGGGMIRDALTEEAECTVGKQLTAKVLLAQAVATSIDAFAVGVSFCANGTNIAFSAPVIAGTTLLLSGIAVLLGGKIGPLFGKKAQIFGGLILIVIGIKAFFS